MRAGNGRQSGGHDGDIFDLSRLTAAAAYELSSPLVLLRQLGFALANDDLRDSEREKLVNQMTLTTERALRLTSSLAMISPRQTELDLGPVNPISVCQDVVHQLTPLFAAYGQHVTMQSRIRTPLLVANRQALMQVLLGFGDNALHYGSSVHPIHFSITGHNDKVRIGVRDHGPAVPIDTWQKLEGKIAQQARAPLATRPQASGVGLLAVKKLADMMGSAVGVVRHRDGATFYIDLRVSNQMSLL